MYFSLRQRKIALLLSDNSSLSRFLATLKPFQRCVRVCCTSLIWCETHLVTLSISYFISPYSLYCSSILSISFFSLVYKYCCLSFKALSSSSRLSTEISASDVMELLRELVLMELESRNVLVLFYLTSWVCTAKTCCFSFLLFIISFMVLMIYYLSRMSSTTFLPPRSIIPMI